MAFYSYQSNRLEMLADRLADLLGQPLRSPLAREVVVTPGTGLARWLGLRLAEDRGTTTWRELTALMQRGSARAKRRRSAMPRGVDIDPTL